VAKSNIFIAKNQFLLNIYPEKSYGDNEYAGIYQIHIKDSLLLIFPIILQQHFIVNIYQGGVTEIIFFLDFPC